MGSMGALYLVNFISFCVFLSGQFRNDLKFRSYLNRSCSNRLSYSFALTICLLINHKYCNILFTKLFNFGIFKAQLTEVSNFKPLHIMSFLSLAHSISAIGVSGYISYNNSTNINQIFLAGVDVVAVTVINLIMAGANAHKDDSFFVEKEGDYTLNKRIIDNDEYEVGNAVMPEGEDAQFVKGYLTATKYKNLAGDSDSQNSSNMMLDDKLAS